MTEIFCFIFCDFISLPDLEIVDVESSVPGLFSTAVSPSKKKAGLAGTSKVNIQLKHTDTSEFSFTSLARIDLFRMITVPIFDGQNKQFMLNRSLEHLEQLLPPFNGEIPHGSLALVAYTANVYYRMQKTEGSRHQIPQSIKNLALNVNWAVVLGVPK